MRPISILFVLALGLAIVQAPVIASEIHAPSSPNFIVDYGVIQPDGGWLLTSNDVYVTVDEGRSWRQATPHTSPESLVAAHFLPGGLGWLLIAEDSDATPDSFALARTSDFGEHWVSASISLMLPQAPAYAISRIDLNFTNAQTGTLVISYFSSSNFARWSEWRTHDSGATWNLLSLHEDLASSGVVPNAERFTGDGRYGWRLEQAGRCSEPGRERRCKQVAQLQVTHDAGATWTPASLPTVLSPTSEWTVEEAQLSGAGIAALGSRIMIATGQGFDKCEAPTLDQLLTWRWTSPYSAVNLYIGGSLRACANSALNVNYLMSAHKIGWTFIPTWVGPQAPCTSYRLRISSDPATAQSQGRAEANAAADTLRRLGLTEADGTGSIVYYDMEAYDTSNGSCNTAVQSFVSGWTQTLRSRGQKSGVYATGSTLRLLVSLPRPPDAIWAAHWIYGSYNPKASVWNVYALSNDVWNNHQRLRQYTGGHWETWGNVAMNIDSDVLDGPVALMVSPAPPIPITPTAWMYLPLVLRR